ncbi:class IV adenylate cyclase [Candidatus Woesearchaeota archaeon]|nr:class IV adenylate cyclase [Candidatus Woesearchaeota archaeon]
MHNIEIEIKLKLDQPEILLNWLKKNAEFVKSSDQIDYYFDPPHKSFIFEDEEGYKDAAEWFRIRVSPKGNELCYKFWHRDPQTNISLYADEIETSIGDEKQVKEMLKRLGFKETSIIEKHRESYRYRDFQFDCDEVKGMGFFVEIEFRGELSDPALGKQKIYDLLNEIGINNWKKTKRGYVWMQWNPGREYFEEGF